MKIFLSAVSSQFKGCRDALASDLRAKGCEVCVQEDFPQGPRTLIEWLETQVAQCDRLIAIIGHAYGTEAAGAGVELQHAREVVTEPEVADSEAVIALFRRIGTEPLHNRTGTIYETNAAIQVGAAVSRDLARNRRRCTLAEASAPDDATRTLERIEIALGFRCCRSNSAIVAALVPDVSEDAAHPDGGPSSQLIMERIRQKAEGMERDGHHPGAPR